MYVYIYISIYIYLYIYIRIYIYVLYMSKMLHLCYAYLQSWTIRWSPLFLSFWENSDPLAEELTSSRLSGPEYRTAF